MLTTDPVPGAPCWADLGTTDTDSAAAFYGALFGWRAHSAGAEAGGYTFLTLPDGRPVAALGPLTEEGARSGWTLYFRVRDVEAVALAVRDAGGAVRSGPMDVFDQGRMAQFTDPVGADFAVWQPGSFHGVGAVGEPGALCWVELNTREPERARTFYERVFGWRVDVTPMPDGQTYSVFLPASGAAAGVTEARGEAGGGAGQPEPDLSFGGLMTMDDSWPARVPSHWLLYFEVTDCDAVAARARQDGGEVLVPPTPIEGVGTFAVLQDPFGAGFSIIRSEPASAA
ncbi:VOC family protein [Allostreptomyces psammosilenae]|uniref:VOC domain-containing protein n=1 Tax=Allostreptomyces psammosilenae TaxID=1892865 RepID=A0A853A3H9_9ACTN|nr:VOC family protein [Allostreptomyces psammosilenae]NYI05038.1 hypothetical protein [Allostreptomyces psammosilenae]